MFDRNHILYILISGIITIVLLGLCSRFVKDQDKKDKILKLAAILTVAIHYSVLYVDYFSTGTAEVESTMLLPIYPCNVAMWLLLIVAFMKNRRGKVYTVLSEFTFYLGITGGIIGIVFNEIYIGNPNLADYDVLNGLLSHSTLLFGAIYLLVGGYINIRVSNVKSVFYGLMLLLVDGVAIISLYRLFGMDSPNCMYLLENPFPQIKWFNTFVLGVIGLIVVFIITSIYEQVALPESNRWYIKEKEESKERRI
jgi:hypothetical protein